MRLVVQRVKDCSVKVGNVISGSISYGLLSYLCVEKGDNATDMKYLVNKLAGLRVFNDENGKMNLSVSDIRASVMVVSQFTLCADTRKGFRPSYNNAGEPETARKLYNEFIQELKNRSIHVENGQFQMEMEVLSTNDGPVTILLDSRKIF